MLTDFINVCSYIIFKIKLCLEYILMSLLNHTQSRSSGQKFLDSPTIYELRFD